MTFSKTSFFGLLLLIPLFLACPLTDQTESAPDAITDTGAPGDTPGKVVPLSGYALNLQENDFWTFYWDWSDKATWTSSYDSGTDNEAASGYMTVTLGGSTVIEGKTLYRTILSGDIPSRFTTNPFWTYLGSDNGSLIGSNGTTVQNIINGQNGTSANSFFKRYALTETTALSISGGSFSSVSPVSWSTTTDIATYDNEYNDTISVPGYNPIAGDEYTRTIGEHYKKGVGPIGCTDYEYLYDRESSSVSTTYITRWRYVLVKTSLAASDGFVLPMPAWQIAGNMPATMEDPSAVVLDGSVYLVGGGYLSAGQKTLWKQSPTGQWSALAPIPSDFSGLYGFGTACAYNGKIYFFCEAKSSYKTTVFAYTPSSNTWTTETSLTSFYPSASVINGSSILLIGKYGTLKEYNTATKVFTDNGYLSNKYTSISMTRNDAGLYTVGQFNTYGDVYTTGIWTCNSSGWSQKSWFTDSIRRWKPALAIYKDRLFVFGGNGKEVISCAIVDGATSDWKTHSPMLYGGASLSALVRGDTVFVYGTNGGKTIETYVPDND